MHNWFDRPMRWVQMSFVENDPGRYDKDLWLAYIKHVQADAVLLSGGGCVAFYPTEIPYHHRSQWMGDSDPFGELAEACREMGLVIVMRTDPHSIRQDAYEAHPEWVHINADGTPWQHWADPSRWVTCALGPYNFKFMTEVHREIMQNYMIEGIFSNRWAGHGMCYCESCQKNFRDATGMDLPRSTDLSDPAYRAYLTWKEERLFQLWEHWDTTLREINPDARFIPNYGGGQLSDMNLRRMGQKADMLVADRQSRSGLTPIWASGRNAKEYRAVMGTKPIAHMFNVGLESGYRWKDSVENDDEIRMWVADSIANGMRPWVIKFSGYLHDTRWLPVVESIFKWHAEVERYMRNTESLARVGMVYSQQTARWYGKQIDDHTKGFYHAMIEARIPFDHVHDELLDKPTYKTLILPNVAALSDAQCDQIRAFVRNGGGVVATYHTSLYDETGQRRENFGLSDLFGVDFVEEQPGPIKNSYLNLEGNPRHALLADMDRADRIVNGVYQLTVKANTSDHLAPPLTVVPSYPDLPMEEVYPRPDRTAIPGVYLREYGAGRVVYFPFDIDRLFWDALNTDHGKLLRNAVRWASNEAPPVEVQGPGVLDVTLWRQAESLTVHLVNLTNPMLMKGPIRELIPVGQQQVRIKLPAEMTMRQVRLLKLDQIPHYTLTNGYLTVNVPSILDHEVVAVDL